MPNGPTTAPDFIEDNYPMLPTAGARIAIAAVRVSPKVAGYYTNGSVF
ncbi:MAG: hypothetical protein P8Y53_19560 [Pseudolabrys sp.]|jgi:hypothetical protein